MKENEILENLKKEMEVLVEKITSIMHVKTDFIPGVSNIPVNGRVFDSSEIKNLVSASLEFWLTDGDYSEEFSRKMSKFLSMKHVRIVNSGSSANLVALSALTNKKFYRNLKFKPS